MVKGHPTGCGLHGTVLFPFFLTLQSKLFNKFFFVRVSSCFCLFVLEEYTKSEFNKSNSELLGLQGF